MHGYMRRCSLSLTHTQAPRTNHVKGQLCLMSLAHQATVSSVAKLGGPPERRRYAQQGRCSALRPALPHLGELPVGKRELKALPNDLRLPLSHAGRLPELLQLVLHIGQPRAQVNRPTPTRFCGFSTYSTNAWAWPTSLGLPLLLLSGMACSSLPPPTPDHCNCTRMASCTSSCARRSMAVCRKRCSDTLVVRCSPRCSPGLAVSQGTPTHRSPCCLPSAIMASSSALSSAGRSTTSDPGLADMPAIV